MYLGLVMKSSPHLLPIAGSLVYKHVLNLERCDCLGVIYLLFLLSRGDHTSADSYLTVLPRATEFVVFSIDGSFAASVSIMGSDPKVRAGAVDVVRYVAASLFNPSHVVYLFSL